MNVAQSIVKIKTLIENEDCRPMNILLNRTVARVWDYLFTELFPMEEWKTEVRYVFRDILRESDVDYEICSFVDAYYDHMDSYGSCLDFISEDYYKDKKSGWTEAKTLGEYRRSLNISHAEYVLKLLHELLAYLEENYHVRADQIELCKKP